MRERHAEYAEGEGYQGSWKNVVSSRPDNERLKKEKPDIYAEYLRQQISKVIRPRFQIIM